MVYCVYLEFINLYYYFKDIVQLPDNKYALNNYCEYFKIELKNHHNSKEDTLAIKNLTNLLYNKSINNENISILNED